MRASIGSSTSAWHYLLRERNEGKPPAVTIPKETRLGEFVTAKSSQCAVCLENISPIHRVNLGCGHPFHKKCIDLWLNMRTTCPTCKSDSRTSTDLHGSSVKYWVYRPLFITTSTGTRLAK